MTRLSILAITTALVTSCAMFGGDRHDRGEHRSAEHHRGDRARHFMQDAAMGGLAEVQLGKLAQERASNRQVATFARRMVDDHSRANDDLRRLAAKKGVTLPSSLDAEHQAARDRLSKLSGAAFDRAYMELMTTDHDHTVEEFRRASSSSKDEEIRAFAARTLPTLEEHRREARRIHDALARADSPGRRAGADR